MKTAHQLNSGVYRRLGIDLKDVGCLMIDTTNPVEHMFGDYEPYVSPDESKFWIKGLLDSWHVTARYGFLDGINRDDVDEVLDGISLPSRLTVSAVEEFESPYKEEQYTCLVARVEDEKLIEVNKALSILPNINTFPEYKAHITIGYFKQGKVPKVKLQDVEVLGLNYGHKL